jgi:hypothetical protein
VTHRPRFLLLLLLAGFIGGSSPSAQSPLSKQAQAHRLNGRAIHVDGLLDEDAWTRAKPLTDFVQKEPVEGAEPSERMEVRFAYDPDALYVAFRLWSADVAALQAPLGRRDDSNQAEHVIVSLDT